MEILPLYECGSLPKFLHACRAASLPDGKQARRGQSCEGNHSADNGEYSKHVLHTHT